MVIYWRLYNAKAILLFRKSQGHPPSPLPPKLPKIALLFFASAVTHFEPIPGVVNPLQRRRRHSFPRVLLTKWVRLAACCIKVGEGCGRTTSFREWRHFPHLASRRCYTRGYRALLGFLLWRWERAGFDMVFASEWDGGMNNVVDECFVGWFIKNVGLAEDVMLWN